MKFNLNVKCFNCEEYFCPTTNTDAGIMEAANNCGYHLWEDEFYCDSCYEDDIKPDIDFEELWQKEKAQRENLEKLNREIFQNLSSEQEKVKNLTAELANCKEQIKRYESLEEMKTKKFNTDDVPPIIPINPNPPKSKFPFWNGE